jgi:hypothetical protein
LIILSVITIGTGQPVVAQIYRIGAGISFATGFEFNGIEIGNPGAKVKTWIALDKRSTIHIVPTLSAFNKNRIEAGYYSLTNYMFMGDLDGQYLIYKEGTLGLIAFTGVNFTYLSSVVAQTDPKYPIPDYAPDSQNELAVGGNIGAGLELRMASQWDMNVIGKYIVSKHSQFLISVEGVYYFKSRRKAYRR